MKKCSRCKEDKPRSSFYKHPRGKEGLYAHCRSCHLAYTANWARLNPEKKRQHARDAYRRNPERYRQHSSRFHWENRDSILPAGRKRAHQRWMLCVKGLGGACYCCGEQRMSMLEIDHVEGFGNEHRKKAGGSVGVYCEIIRTDFPKGKYRVACANCNQSSRRNGGMCEHQTERRKANG